MSNTTSEARALEQTVGVYERKDLLVYHLQGEEQRSWLNGQLTSDVRSLCSGQSVYGLAVTVKGRIMADTWALDDGQQLHILLPVAAKDMILASFDNQIIMEDVELEHDGGIRVLSVQGPAAGSALSELELAGVRRFPADELGHGGYFLLVPDANFGEVRDSVLAKAHALAGAEVSPEGYGLARLRAGRPSFPEDFGEQSYPQEAGLKERAVSFNKGCYLGQEVICTLENRGKVARALYRLRSHGHLRAGAKITNAEGNVVGQVTSATLDPEAGVFLALGYLKRAQVEGKAVLSSEGAAVVVGDLVQ